MAFCATSSSLPNIYSYHFSRLMQYTLKPCPVGVFGHGLDMSQALKTLLVFKGLAVLIFHFLKRATLTERLEIDMLFWAGGQSVFGLAAWMGVSPLSYRLLCY